VSEEVKFDDAQQALVDKLVGDARVKAREKAQAEFTTKADDAKRQAEETALIAQKEWQKLAAKHEARVKALEPLEAQAKAYGELVAGMLKAKVKELGDDAKKAIGAFPEALTAIEKLTWLNQNEGLFQAPSDGVGTPARKKAPQTKKKAKDAGHRRMRL